MPRSPFMSRFFAPSFQGFQKDIERCLKSKGQVEKNELGQTVYRGYQTGLDEMFRTYIDEGAFAPLVAEFRKWNWEWDYDEHLLELTARLQQKGDWPLSRISGLPSLRSAEPITTRPERPRRRSRTRSLTSS